MKYDEIVIEVRAAIIAALNTCRPKIEEIGKHPIGTSKITGLAVEVVPFEDIFALHFRDGQNEKEIDFADWSHCEMFHDSPLHKELLSKIKEAYNASEDGERYILMLNTAVADALLCDEVVAILKSLSMATYFELDELGNNPFDFVVLDMDECIQANFCDIIRWKRNVDSAALT